MEYKSLVKKLLDPTLSPYNINLILAKLLFINNENFRECPGQPRNTSIISNNYNLESETIDNDTDNFISSYFNKNVGNMDETNIKTNEAIMSKLRKISNLQNQISKTKQK
jgi:hypothetical protein